MAEINIKKAEGGQIFVFQHDESPSELEHRLEVEKFNKTRGKKPRMVIRRRPQRYLVRKLAAGGYRVLHTGEKWTSLPEDGRLEQ